MPARFMHRFVHPTRTRRSRTVPYVAALAATLLWALPGPVRAEPSAGQSAHKVRGHVAAALGLKDDGAAARLLAARVAVAPADFGAQVHLRAVLDRMALDGNLAGVEGVRQVLPGWPPVLERLGAMYDDRRRYADAEGALKTWLRARPGNPEPAARLAEHYARTGRAERAVALLQRHKALVGGESDYADRRIEGVLAQAERDAARHPDTGRGMDVAQASRAGGPPDGRTAPASVIGLRGGDHEGETP